MKNKFLGITGISLFLLASCFSNIGEAKNKLTLSNKSQIPSILAQRDRCKIFRHTQDSPEVPQISSFVDILFYPDQSLYYRSIDKSTNNIITRGTGTATSKDGKIIIEMEYWNIYNPVNTKLTYIFRSVQENGRLVLINQYDDRYYTISGSCRKSDFWGS